MEFTMDTPMKYAPILLSELKILNKGKFKTFSEMLVLSRTEISRRCKAPPDDINRIYEKLVKACKPATVDLKTLTVPLFESFTTGDSVLDKALGGGIRTCMVLEIAGESSAGKTQLGLQLALTVQLPRSLGGLSGTAVYLCTHGTLLTTRLQQLARSHPVISQARFVGLQHISTLPTQTLLMLEHVLENILPPFIKEKASSPNPVKLVVIDAIAELFHADAKYEKQAFFDRANQFWNLGRLLHETASKYGVAIVILNEVVDRFIETGPIIRTKGFNPRVWNEMTQWCTTAHSIPGENLKQAALGVTWTKQLNARILLTNTRRRRFIDAELPDGANQAKKARLHPGSGPSHSGNASARDEDEEEEQATLVRRLSLVFSTVAPAVSLDYILTAEGVFTLPDDALEETLKKGNRYEFVDDEEDEWDAFWETAEDPSEGVDVDAIERAALAPQTVQPVPPQFLRSREPEDKGAEDQDEDDGAENEDFDACEFRLTQAQPAFSAQSIAKNEDDQAGDDFSSNFLELTLSQQAAATSGMSTSTDFPEPSTSTSVPNPARMPARGVVGPPVAQPDSKIEAEEEDEWDAFWETAPDLTVGIDLEAIEAKFKASS
ncbi:P-loop containing nucleoside triphosphate hydrolase protein [Ephemerocybe angulata]|uniref:P-loop containing nucleoside triphosphate hydrolase protein n=1 Tax=Ephemerocybe angulata TaxID=980116 RepID=A0A8H6HBY9_9AGAR|nr:P-loop containing nucleoside triphosphate hydrolase protein [Tulosesus angulatus]